MNTHQHDETLYRVTAEILESLALMFLVPEDEAPHPTPQCNRCVTVSFTGPFDGMLAMAVSDGILTELAANMLGLESGRCADNRQQEDALRELANVICGNLLPVIGGSELLFNINIPEVLAETRLPEPTECLSLTGEARLFADAGILELKFFVDQTVVVST